MSTPGCSVPKPGQMDVYTDKPRTGLDDAALGRRSFRINVTAEVSPMSLSRIFGLTGTLSLVPAVSTTAVRSDDLMEVQLEFPCADARQLDLLHRKFEQLTETVSVDIVAT